MISDCVGFAMTLTLVKLPGLVRCVEVTWGGLCVLMSSSWKFEKDEKNSLGVRCVLSPAAFDAFRGLLFSCCCWC